jgi:hypothetical protein
MALEPGTKTANGTTRPTGHSSEARLVGHPGVGVLQVWRGQHGQALEYAGTWRHELREPAGESERRDLERAMREGRAVPFDGRFDDPGQPQKASVHADVRISSIGEYLYRVEPDDPDSETVPVVLVNFRPVGEIEGV